MFQKYSHSMLTWSFSQEISRHTNNSDAKTGFLYTMCVSLAQHTYTLDGECGNNSVYVLFFLVARVCV